MLFQLLNFTFWLGTTLFAGGVLATGQTIPQVTADSLNGKHISLPVDFGGKSAILIVGFSRAGGDQCGPFAHRLTKEPSVLEGSVRLYQIAMLESAPRLVRSMILHGMRSGVPKNEQDRFLPLFHGEKEWKQIAGFTKAAEDEAYLLLVGSDGTVRWTSHGRYSEDLYLQFKKHLL